MKNETYNYLPLLFYNKSEVPPVAVVSLSGGIRVTRLNAKPGL